RPGLGCAARPIRNPPSQSRVPSRNNRGSGGDRAAARGVRGVPVLHVVLLGKACGAPDLIIAEEPLDLRRRVLVDEKPPPNLRLIRPTRVPDGNRARLAR